MSFGGGLMLCQRKQHETLPREHEGLERAEGIRIQ